MAVVTRATVTINEIDFTIVQPTEYAARIAGNRRYAMTSDDRVWVLAHGRIVAYDLAWELDYAARLEVPEDAEVLIFCDCGWRTKRRGLFYADCAMSAHDTYEH